MQVFAKTVTFNNNITFYTRCLDDYKHIDNISTVMGLDWLSYVIPQWLAGAQYQTPHAHNYLHK